MADSTDTPPSATNSTPQNDGSETAEDAETDAPQQTPPDELPSEPPGEQDKTTEHVAWVLVGMVALAVFILPLLFPSFTAPAGTVGALLTAITTLLITRKMGGAQGGGRQ